VAPGTPAGVAPDPAAAPLFEVSSIPSGALPMIVGVVSCELHLPESRSLKDKRRVVKSLVERIFQRYRVSIAETAFQELHQRAEISIAVVAQKESEIQKLMEHIRDLLDSQPEVYLTRWDPQLLEAQP
jgi:uncharacterized protein YlxP (DUF503 family)